MGKSHDLATLKNGGTIDGALTVDGAIESLKDAYGEGGHLTLRADPTYNYRFNVDNYQDSLRVFKEDDATSANGAVYMTIDASGRVTMPYQLHIEGTPNNSGGNGVANAFYTRNTPVGLSFSNSRITAPIAGRYLVCWNTIADSGSGRVDTYIYINGTAVINSMQESNHTAYRFRGSAHVFNLAANDYIQFYHQDFYAGTSISGWENWNNASVTLLG